MYDAEILMNGHSKFERLGGSLFVIGYLKKYTINFSQITIQD